MTATESTQLDNINSKTNTIQTDISTIQTDLAVMNKPKKNQAFNNFMFLMVDTADLRTPLTGLTVTGQRSIDGGAFTAIEGTISEVGLGIYAADLTANDTNGDSVTYVFTATGAIARYMTVITS